MSAAGMIAEARKSLGMSGRPNTITKEYASRHGDEFLRAAWCDMAITYWARHSGNHDAVCLGKDYAYTVWHAEAFKKVGRWHTGTTASVNQAKPGDIVFFDWGATNNVGAIDHVGVVEKVLGGGRLQTIEGNTGDAVKRRVRDSGVIAGYGRPAYGGGNWTEDMVKKLPELSKGDTGEHVESVQGLLLARSHPEVSMTGKFDDATEQAVKAVQRWGGVDDDGIVGAKTWPVLLRVH
ncbi:peptidoglycan-binding protein [Actinomadura madurae]|uniref:peptidoglycan-binding protein n=1 Tax=Actinomadura madurae TaxID=1993 RepID=UPI0020D241BA|nr:peptidoglycan-binding protein [Actinomadura madurae]MCP9953101.1 CHAP domain-containing protein [Actinomadura madurae]MCP9969867.1 CHAP domain-containing protein [Actinomadura madurae]MCQ0018562.1 CHAP domain-containing protein [Actinomadura madurae]